MPVYHPHSIAQDQKRRRRVLMVVVAIVLAVVISVAIFVQAQKAVVEQTALSMRTAILERAMQCCAVEGSYPQSIEYLEQNYGLSVNHSDFNIYYDCYADNIVPSVVVVPK